MLGAGAGGVSRAAADRAERGIGDIGAEADQPSQHQQRGHPAPCVCIETESRSEVKSRSEVETGSCTDHDELEVIRSFCLQSVGILPPRMEDLKTDSIARTDRGQRIKFNLRIQVNFSI